MECTTQTNNMDLIWDPVSKSYEIRRRTKLTISRIFQIKYLILRKQNYLAGYDVCKLVEIYMSDEPLASIIRAKGS
jgi:hypothetical protein